MCKPWRPRSEAVTASVANTAKRVFVIVGVALVLGESLNPLKLLGCGIGIGGVFLYSLIDNIIPPKPKEEPTPPANVVLAVSMACCRAAAKHSDLELHEYIAQLANVSDPCIPVPVFSVINGADAASSPLHLQVSRDEQGQGGTSREEQERVDEQGRVWTSGKQGGTGGSKDEQQRTGSSGKTQWGGGKTGTTGKY